MTTYPEFDQVKRIGILGTGTIGASWTAYFLAHGYAVTAWDPGDNWQEKLTAFVDTAWPQLTELGLGPGATKAALTMVDTPEEAVATADFVQENGPERLPIKQELCARIDDALPATTVLASSTSGLIMSDMAEGVKSAPRFVVGHPFNPPHLIPLVEVVAGKDSDPAAVDWAMGFYRHAGKHSIRINKEVPGHLANRLQAALWREATWAVANDLASIEDINAAMAQGPGLRLALMGPHMIFNLTGGKGGFQHFFDHFTPGIANWWSDMQGDPELTDALRDKIWAGLKDETGARSLDDLEHERDLRLVELLKMLQATKSQIKQP